MLSRIMDKDRVVKLEICTLKGTVLLTVSKNYTFPFKLNDKDRYGRENTGQNVIIRGKNLPVFARNAPVKVVAHTKAGERVSYPGHIEMSAEKHLNIYLRVEAGEVMDERRRFYKISEEIPCSIISVTRGENHTDFDTPIGFMIGDINIGGVFIMANNQLELEGQDTVEVILEDHRGKTQLTAKVLRVQRNPEGKIKGYGCQFLFINTRQEEVVAGFINKIQMERRKLELSENSEAVPLDEL